MKGIILTEGGEGIGWGHIFRCTAIHHALIEKKMDHDFLVNYKGNLINSNEHFFQRSSWLEKKISGNDFLIIDSYLADLNYYKELSANNRLIVSIDDYLRLQYPKGLVVNGSVLADKLPYDRVINNYLLGTSFIPIRKIFWNNKKRNINKIVKEVFLTFGGEDSFNLSQKALEMIAGEGFHINLVLGPNHKNKDDIIEKFHKQVTILHNLNSQEMYEYMLKADIALSAGGQTTYELAATGTPSILFQVAENQKINLENWKKTGFIGEIININDKNWEKLFLNVFKNLLLNYEERKNRSAIGQSYVDGKGANRIADEIKKIIGSNDK